MSATALSEYIQRVVDQAPPLTAAQRDLLALLLSPKPAPSEPKPIEVPDLGPSGSDALAELMNGDK